MPHVYVHFLGDGRDTAPRSAAGYARELRAFVEKLGVGEVATVVGRYYAMDRDKRWERVQIAVEGLVHGKGAVAEGGDYVAAIEARYEKDETDEFLKPIIVNGEAGRIKGALRCFCVLAGCSWMTLGSTLHGQMAIRCSCSITARTACARSPLSLVRWKSPSTLSCPRTSYVTLVFYGSEIFHLCGTRSILLPCRATKPVSRSRWPTHRSQ